MLQHKEFLTNSLNTFWCDVQFGRDDVQVFQHQLPVEILIRIPTVQIRTASCTYILTTFRLKCTNKIASNDYILQKIKKYSYNCNDRIERTSVCI